MRNEKASVAGWVIAAGVNGYVSFMTWAVVFMVVVFGSVFVAMICKYSPIFGVMLIGGGLYIVGGLIKNATDRAAWRAKMIEEEKLKEEERKLREEEARVRAEEVKRLNEEFDARAEERRVIREREAEEREKREREEMEIRKSELKAKIAARWKEIEREKIEGRVE